MDSGVYLAMELVEKDRVRQTVARFYKRLSGASAEAGKVPGGTTFETMLVLKLLLF